MNKNAIMAWRRLDGSRPTYDFVAAREARLAQVRAVLKDAPNITPKDLGAQLNVTRQTAGEYLRTVRAEVAK